MAVAAAAMKRGTNLKLPGLSHGRTSSSKKRMLTKQFLLLLLHHHPHCDILPSVVSLRGFVVVVVVLVAINFVLARLVFSHCSCYICLVSRHLTSYPLHTHIASRKLNQLRLGWLKALM